MKKLVGIGVLLFGMVFLLNTEVQAQAQTGFGIKAGMNYNSNGKFFKDAEMIWGDPWDNMGYHVGLFSKVNLGPIYLRPELLYSNMQGKVDGERYHLQRMDLPVLAGINLIGNLVTVFAGPSFHYNLSDQYRDFSNALNAGYQAGVGINLGNIGVDLRYEKEFFGREISFADAIGNDRDFKFQQVLLGISLSF